MYANYSNGVDLCLNQLKVVVNNDGIINIFIHEYKAFYQLILLFGCIMYKLYDILVRISVKHYSAVLKRPSGGCF